MKTRIIYLFTFLFVFTGKMILAQDYKIPVENANEATLQLSDFSGKMTIVGYSGNEIIIAPAEKVGPPPERAKGLKPVFSNGTDNTGIGLNVEKDGNRVMISNLLPFTQQRELTLQVPENMALSISSGCEYNNDLYISKMNDEIEIQTCHSINLQQVTGPLVLSTIGGNIDITFGMVNTLKPFSINSISGEIDITLPSKLAADIEMGTITGSMYSDFDFSNTRKDLNQVGGNHLDYKMNGGGIQINIVTVSGNIYLRKGA
jgi:hypothetical protein